MSTKADLRTRIAKRRADMTEGDRNSARTAIRDRVLSRCHSIGLRAGARIGAYEPLRTEPGSTELLLELHRAGFELLVPITLSDRDLDWAYWTPESDARRPLGRDAIGSASLVLVPAFAVDVTGNRLGRGGGSYDRALTRVPAGVPVAALLYSDEIVEVVPVDDWDRRVSDAVTPDGWRELAAR